jgi:hypothetical protein
MRAAFGPSRVSCSVPSAIDTAKLSRPLLGVVSGDYSAVGHATAMPTLMPQATEPS